ncbi:MAG TPA: hypothetical protein VKA68_05280, partial [bacterium]|nr:hypothetical protein [bacterium]
MYHRKYFTALILLCIAGTSIAGCVLPVFLSPELRPYFFTKREAATGLDTIRPDSLRSHITYLASSELQGRETSYPGQQMAADYLASYFRYLGLEPLQQADTYIQSVPLQRVFPAPAQTVRVITARDTLPLTLNQDYLLSSRGVYSDMELDAQVVFIGYGLDLESWGYDEYDTVNVARKWVLIIDGMPRVPATAAPAEKRAFTRMSQRAYKYWVAKNAGAAGVLMAPDTRSGRNRRSSYSSPSQW